MAKRRKAREPWNKSLAVRLFKFVTLRPLFAFSVTFLLVAAVSLAPSRAGVAAFYVLTFPVLFIILIILNLPFIGAAIRRFRLSDAAKMNHALEHGTIYYLRRRYGKQFKIGGRALEDGFRINGLNSPEYVAEAFGELQQRLRLGDSRRVVSRRCGSNIVTAQALAAALLVGSLATILVLNLERRTTLAVLAFNVIVYLLFRYPVGNLIQRLVYVSVGCSDAAILSINEVKPDSILERRPVFFVRTAVRANAVGNEKPNQRSQTPAGADVLGRSAPTSARRA